MVVHPKLAVVAVGGNSLIVNGEHEAIPYQSQAAAAAAHHIADMIAQGWNVVITHGNGPQVGFILRRSEVAIHEVPPVPMNYATADTQGVIGYMFQRALRNEFRQRGIDRGVAAVVTQTLVDRGDPAFVDPTKPIGSLMEEEYARKLASKQGWIVKEDAGRGWRRVVPSPLPRAIIEEDVITQLLAGGAVVIACGGGGLPVFRDERGDLQGVEAVIDKDLASSLLARDVGAEVFLITTSVEKVAIHFNRPDQQWLDQLTLSQARTYYAQGHFAEGSMGPKIEAVIEFLERGGRRGVITDPPHMCSALAGASGTSIVPD